MLSTSTRRSNYLLSNKKETINHIVSKVEHELGMSAW